MQRRAILLLILLVVLAVFYAAVTRTSVPVITAEQKTQTQMLDRLDEHVLGPVASGAEEDADGDAATDGVREASGD